MRKALCFVLGVSILLISSVLRADSLRCGTQIISTGDRAFEVERKCGPPTYRDLISTPEDRYYGYGQRSNSIIIEEWVYGPNNGAFNILRFESNRLTRIETQRAD